MKDIRPTRGQFHVMRLIEQGEHEQQDFKYAVSDARKIARTVSAFANNSGGRLLIGVKDNGTIAGVRNEEDIYVVEQGAQMYCEPPVEVSFHAYRTATGTVIQATVPRAARRPVSVREEDGRLQAYFRVADENIVAPEVMVRAWEANNSDCSGSIYTHDTMAVLEAVDRSPEEGVIPERLAFAAHISTAGALEAAASLVASGVLRLRFHAGRFVLERSHAED